MKKLRGLKIVGKVDLAQFEKKAITITKGGKKTFKPFSGGSTIGERLRAQGIRL